MFLKCVEEIDDVLAQLRGVLSGTSHPEIANLSMAQQPAKFSAGIGDAAVREPLLGEHTDEVLKR